MLRFVDRFLLGGVILFASGLSAIAVPNGQTPPISDASALTITGNGSNVPRTAAARAADEINGLDYSNFSSAIAQAASTNKVIRLPPGNYSYAGGTTLTVSTPVVFEPGAVLSCSGSNVVFSGLLSAPRSQIFASGCTPGISKVDDGVYPDWWGAKPDATGVTGVGTDSTNAFKAALAIGWTKVKIAQGTYRVTGPVRIAGGTTVECAGQENTFIRLDDPAGAADMFTINVGNASSVDNQISVKGCNVGRSQQATAGALFHLQATALVRFIDNQIGQTANTYAWEGVRVDCGSTAAGFLNELYFEGNVIAAKYDDVNFQCINTTATIADVFFEKRNYFWNAQHAAVEMAGGVGWIHFDDADFDQNTGVALLHNSNNGATGSAAYISVHHSHFEGNTKDIDFTGVGMLSITGNEFLGVSPTAGIICTNCSNVVTSGNIYGNSAHMVVNGSGGWTESGSAWSTTSASLAGMIQIGPNGVSASNGITIDGGTFAFNATPFVTFTGNSAPAYNIKMTVNNIQGACFSGTNYTAGSFVYNCGAYGNGATIPGQLNILAPGNGITGNLRYDSGWRYNSNGGAGGIMFGYDGSGAGTAHAIEFFAAQNNTGGANAAAYFGLAGYVEQYGGLVWKGGVSFPATFHTGSVPTYSGTCNVAAQAGGSTAGTFKAASSCPNGTIIVSLPTATNGWVCDAHDLTTPSNAINETATSTTTVTFTGAMVNNDVVAFKCDGF